MSRKHIMRIEELSSMMCYILGRSPWEFGLVPDMNEYIPLRELLKAFSEEPGWSHVKRGAINEVLLSDKRIHFELENDRIRTVERYWDMDTKTPAKLIPKILYTGIRQKAHSFVLDKGLLPGNDSWHIMSASREMAERRGRRQDINPVIMEIMAARALEQGLSFYCFGDLFLIRELPAEFIAGPPLPKQFLRALEEKPRKAKEKKPDTAPGTFIFREDNDPDRLRNAKGKKKRSWKEESRKVRRNGREF